MTVLILAPRPNEWKIQGVLSLRLQVRAGHTTPSLLVSPRHFCSDGRKAEGRSWLTFTLLQGAIREQVIIVRMSGIGRSTRSMLKIHRPPSSLWPESAV